MSGPTQITPEHARLIRKLESISHLSDDDRAAVAGLPLEIREFAEDRDIVREGDRPTHCCLMLDGFACRYKVLQDGQRQILSFHNAGDVPDLQSLHLKVMDHSLGALTPSRVGLIPHGALHALTRTHPDVGAAMWKDTLIDAAIFREWLTGVGRRSAYARIAHLLCEMFTRLRAVGLSDDGRGFDLPVTQAELADSLGLSTVHVNRTLQELRRDGLIVSRGKYWGIENWPGLKAAGDFDPTYLHIQRNVDDV